VKITSGVSHQLKRAVFNFNNNQGSVLKKLWPMFFTQVWNNVWDPMFWLLLMSLSSRAFWMSYIIL